MRNSVYRKQLNLELFCNCDTLYLYKVFEKSFQVMKKIKLLKLKGNWDKL